jgi:hypothetical protein
MATDNTPPRIKLIATIALIVVITLVSLEFVFKSYYGFMTDEAQREKLAPTTAKAEQQIAEQASFAGAKMPIDEAMAQLKGSRAAIIQPTASDDLAALTGWSKLPKALPAGTPTAAVAPGAGAAPAAGDAGATGAAPLATGDSGAPGAPLTTGDAGAAPGLAPAPAPAASKDAGAPSGH